MEIKETEKMESTSQKIQLVIGEFTPSQASDLLMALIDQKINYHKIENLQLWERNHNTDPNPIKNRIKELENEKKIAKAFISKMRTEGKNINLNGVLEMTSID